MHRLSAGKYVGSPGETVTLTTKTDGGGQVGVTLDGQNLGSARQFQLPLPAGTSKLQIALTGPLNATCVVGIAVVDGASDGDLLMCSSTDPAPVHFYDFTAAPAAAVTALASITRARNAPPRTTKRVSKAGSGKRGKKK